jgi:hypothetical protein
MKTRIVFPAPWVVPLVLICLIQVPAFAQTTTSPLGTRPSRDVLGTNPSPDGDISPSLSPKQKQSIVRANFERSKIDAAELATLAKELCKELDKPTADALSPEIVSRVGRIEKLAKKIRDETKGF